MRKNDETCLEQGFTRYDLCAMVAACCMLGLVCSAGAAKMKPRSLQISCANNLRQLGQGWQMWSTEHENLPPWYVRAAEGGTTEFGIAWQHYMPLSNYIASPSIFACPGDQTRVQARDYSSNTNGGLSYLQNSAVGYFIATEIIMTEPRCLLSGDRQVRPVTSLETCAGFNGQFKAMPRVGKIRLSGTWHTEVHQTGIGNLVFADGAVYPLNDLGLNHAVRNNAIDAKASGCLLIP